MGIGVCIKLPVLSHVGRAQEREGAKQNERKEGSTGKKDCQSQEKERRERKDDQVSGSSSFKPLAFCSLYAFVHPSPNFSSCSTVIFGSVSVTVCSAVVCFIVYS